MKHRATAGRVRHRAPRRAFRTNRAALVGIVFLVLTFFTPFSPAQAVTPAFTATKTVTRVHLVDGADQVVDTRSVKVTVSTTTNLRDRQGITVTWSGAHPTGGLAIDTTSYQAAAEEYPVVVMQCRGTDSTSVPAGQQVSPETCFTETPVERFANSPSGIAWPSYRMDRYATTDQRNYDVNQPTPLPATCDQEIAPHWLPFIGADGTVYPGGPQGCGGIAPDMALNTAALQPSSTTYGVADVNGTGSTTFIAQSNLSNNSLGCSSKVKCTLEVIPIEGISCDATGTAPAPGGMPVAQRPPTAGIPTIFNDCSGTGQFNPGEFNIGQASDFTPVTGQYWWSASNWRNRISVPLTFAPSADVCNQVTGLSTGYVYGAESMVQATQQWAPAFCLNKSLFNLRHVQTSEPEAKSLLAAGSIQAAFQAGPPDIPFGTATVQAPTAITGFAIVAVVDGANGKPYAQIRLNARLIAKLLTQSYEACALNCLSIDELASNPVDITRDPEFQALNPGISPTIYLAGAATISLISADSDVISALTSYINSDPEARSFLDGRPDPWGMVVNPAYAGIQLPVVSWPLLDTHLASFGGANLCLTANPAPWLPLVAAPVANPALIPLNLQYNVLNSQISCFDGGAADAKLVAYGREQVGSRFLLGLVSLADAQRFELPTAALETHRSTNSTVVFSDATGRSFATPTDAALKAAAALLKPNDATGTWPVPYDTLRTSTAGMTAYPGILLISTDVPTTGLSKQDAVNYSKLLTYAAGRGQVSGIAVGDIPPGYLPITSGNGLAGMVNYTKAAATAVLAQQCVVPYPSGRAAPKASCNLPAKPPTSTPTSQPVSTPSQPTPSISGPAVTPSSSPSSSTPSPSSSSAQPVSVGKTSSIGSGVLGVLFPILALSALLTAAIAGLAVPRRRR